MDSTGQNKRLASHLPMELVIQIVEEGVADPALARTLSQVCSWMRTIALPRAYSTQSPITDVRHFSRIPEHIKVHVRNLWLDDSPLPTTSAAITLRTTWLWSTVSNLAVSNEFINACNITFDAEPEIRVGPPKCTRLTTFGSELLHRPISAGALASSVTHLRFIHDISLGDVILVMHMRSLQYLAVSLNQRNVRDHMVFALALLDHKDLQVIALVLEWRNDPEWWISRVRIAMGFHEKLYVVPGAHSKIGVRKEWNEQNAGREDIWVEAVRLRLAVVNEDNAGIAQFCYEPPLPLENAESKQ